MFSLIVFIVVIVVVVRAINSAKRSGGGMFGGLPLGGGLFGGGLFGGGRELEALFALMEQQIRNYQNLPPEQRRLQDAQMATMWLQMQNQMRSIDAHHRGMYEARAGEIAGYAAQNGIDFKPASW